MAAAAGTALADLPQLALSPLVCRGVQYQVGVSASADELRIDLDEPGAGLRWSATFHARYLEDITQKAGSAKRFEVFVKMLCAALQRQGEALHLDVLTYADLQVLKTRKAAGASAGSGASTSTAAAQASSNKRYIILTYASEFDRVHFPLPLACVGAHVAAHVGAHAPARAAAADVHACSSSFDAQHARRAVATHLSQRRHAEDAADKEHLEESFERLQRDSSRELSRLSRKNESLTLQLQEQAEVMGALRSQLAGQAAELARADKLRDKLKAVEARFDDDKDELMRALDKHKKEILLLNSELSRSKREEERLRRHVRQLEAELKLLQRRNAAAVQSGAAHGRASTLRPAATRFSSADRFGRGASLDRRAASTSLPGSRTASRAPSHASSRASSRTPSHAPPYSSSRAASTHSSRADSIAGSRGSSRCGSAASSAAVSRASSTERMRGRSERAPPPTGRTAATTSASSHASQRVSPRASQRLLGSRASSQYSHASSHYGSHGGSTASSRASSAERARPAQSGLSPSAQLRARSSSRDSVARDTLPRSERRGAQGSAHGSRDAPSRRGHAVPSIERAAREALRQSAMSKRSGAWHDSAPTHTDPHVKTLTRASGARSAARSPHAPTPRHACGPILKGGGRLAAHPFTSDSSDVDDDLSAIARSRSNARMMQQPQEQAHAYETHKENRLPRAVPRDSRESAPMTKPEQLSATDLDDSESNYNAMSDIHDIDRRLNALQDFLKAAKVSAR
uniref:Coiled-coil domain-containing protein 61 n=1 Tax=Chrysotila carterae TaxID=13221 RepID=A0A7S4EW32_CHRCT